jgi:Fe-coproporphyrin III synthase
VPHTLTELSELWIWPHAGCNHRCVSCDIWKDKSRRELSATDVARWADEWAALGVKEVILTGGEALMHTDLFGLADPIRAKGIELTLLSTGILLKKHAARVAEYFDAVVVSLDGPPEVHDEVRRVPRAYALLAAGIGAVRAVDPTFRFQAKCTVHRYNFRHLPETVRTAQQLGMNSLSFAPADVTSEAFNRAGGWDAERQDDLVVAADELPDLAAELDRMFTECADAFGPLIRRSPEQIRTYVLDYYRGFHQAREYPEVSCDLPWSSAVIEVDGTVRPCFFQGAYGNIHEAGSLAEVLNAPEAVRWRAELDVNTDPTCRRCVCHRTIGVPVPVR